MKNQAKVHVFLVLFLGLALISNTGNGQTLNLQNKSKIQVDGISNVHDWTVEATDAKGELQLVTNDSQVGIEHILFTAPVLKLESGKEGMDKKMFKALETDQYKTIRFELTDSKNCQGLSSGENGVDLVGKLTIKGKTKAVSIKSKITIENGRVHIQGTHKLNMKDYGIDPPTALFGTISTGEEVVVKFNLQFI